MNLHLIFARARNGVIGNQGAIPWRLPEDMAHLKRTTMGCPVIMGRKTWDSLPPRFRPLPGRTNVVVTRQTDWTADGAVTANSLTQAIELCTPDGDSGASLNGQGTNDAWVLGGAEIYAQGAPLASTAMVTEIDADFEGDAMAPVLGPEWVEVSREKHVSTNGLSFSFVNLRNTLRPRFAVNDSFLQFAMKLATWNVNSLTVRLPQVLDWLQTNPVDVLALQELKLTDDKFPHAAFTEAGYFAQWFGQKTYNGVALLTRTPVTQVVKNIPGFDDDMARVISADVESSHGPIRVIGGYFPNGQEPGSDKFEYKMNWLKGLRTWVKAELEANPRLVLMGDFNITFDELDMWDPIGLADTIHCTEEERYHLRALVALGLTDSHRLFPQTAKCFSWWDYRDFGFKRNKGLRIDHILISNALKPLAKSCVIDKTPRKNERPSDHAPVVIELG